MVEKAVFTNACFSDADAMSMSVYATENVNNFKDIVTSFKAQGTSK